MQGMVVVGLVVEEGTSNWATEARPKLKDTDAEHV